MPRRTTVISRNNVHSITSIAANQALKSDCVHKLGAVVTKGRNKIMCRGHNDPHRTTFLNAVTNCQHAEMNVATKFINTFVRPRHIKVSNASV